MDKAAEYVGTADLLYETVAEMIAQGLPEHVIQNVLDGAYAADRAAEALISHALHGQAA